MSQKSPEIYLGPKRFRNIFEKRTLAYSLGAPLLGLTKSIYELYHTSNRCFLLLSQYIIICYFIVLASNKN